MTDLRSSINVQHEEGDELSFWSKYPNVQKEMDKVEDVLEKTVKTRRKIVEEASMDLLKAGGKRIRPALTIICAQYGNYDSSKIVPLAAALELFHMATLIHDDIIDNAKKRRGIETAQSKYGKDVAVYTGDYLFSKAFLLAATVNHGEKILHLSRFVKAICEGEIEQHVSKYNYHTSASTYLKRIKYKTALLFGLCCQVGAEISECDPYIIRNLRKYGMALGTAFQLKDDLLDVTGNDETVGKPTGNDILEGVYTLPFLYTIQNTAYGQEVLNILKRHHFTKKDVTEIIHIIKQSGGIQYTKNLEDRYYDKAVSSLKRIPDHECTHILLDLIEMMRHRMS
ncbi:polyprenyl synthetase family protein [Thermotalea metallivorans]|nr:polyprenyl synthetase family protein [Thermotalea metallivorans]